MPFAKSPDDNESWIRRVRARRQRHHQATAAAKHGKDWRQKLMLTWFPVKVFLVPVSGLCDMTTTTTTMVMVGDDGG